MIHGELAFQMADDILDETGTEDDTGKSVGSRTRPPSRSTFVSILGLEQARDAVSDVWRAMRHRITSTSSKSGPRFCANWRNMSWSSADDKEQVQQIRSRAQHLDPITRCDRNPGRSARNWTPSSCGGVADELRHESDRLRLRHRRRLHLGEAWAVAELTVALHYVFNTPAEPGDLGRPPPGLSAQDPDQGGATDIRTLRQGG